MTQPRTEQEFKERHDQSLRFEGSGLGTLVHIPCPFCAAPDYMVFRLFEVTTGLEVGGKCAECGRSSRAQVTREAGSVTFHTVQTGGADPPEFVRMPREEPQ